MSILRQLNDEIIGQLKVSYYPPTLPPGENNLNVGEEFKLKITIENISKQFPQITFSNVALEIVPNSPIAVFKGAANITESKRKLLGTLYADQKKTVEITMVAKSALQWPVPESFPETVAVTKIAADVLLRCKDLDNNPIYVQIYPDED